MLSIIIPSRSEIFLQKTIIDVLEKATGDIEIYPILDGYEPSTNEIVDDPRVKYIRLPASYYTQKRHGINLAVSICKGKYVMSLDAHCMIAKSFDEVLKKDLEENEVVTPRRQRLDVINWCLQKQVDDRPPIDYEYIMWPLQFNPVSFHGYKWDSKTLERWNIPIDETMEIQGSCWLMHKSWFKKCGFMKITGYTGWGQEGEEIVMTTYKNGGRVLTNKKTYFAHLHKGREFGRMYFLPKAETRLCNAYCYNHWVNKNKEFFIKFIERFMPIPGWPLDFERQLYE